MYIGGIADGIRPPSVGVVAVFPERGGFELVGSQQDRDRAVADSRRDGAAEEPEYFLGPGIRRQIEILGVASQKAVPDRAADQPALVTGLSEYSGGFPEIIGYVNRGLLHVERPYRSGVHGVKPGRKTGSDPDSSPQPDS